MYTTHQPFSFKDMYFGSPFVSNTFLGSKVTTNMSSPQNSGPDYTVSLETINQQPETVERGGGSSQSNLLLFLVYAVLIGGCIYYYYQYCRTTKKEENKYQ